MEAHRLLRLPASANLVAAFKRKATGCPQWCAVMALVQELWREMPSCTRTYLLLSVATTSAVVSFTCLHSFYVGGSLTCDLWPSLSELRAHRRKVVSSRAAFPVCWKVIGALLRLCSCVVSGDSRMSSVCWCFCLCALAFISLPTVKHVFLLWAEVFFTIARCYQFGRGDPWECARAESFCAVGF